MDRQPENIRPPATVMIIEINLDGIMCADVQDTVQPCTYSKSCTHTHTLFGKMEKYINTGNCSFHAVFFV